MNGRAAYAVFPLVVTTLLVTACGGVTADDQYQSAEGLHSALQSAGIECEEVYAAEAFDGYGDEVRCREGYLLRVWDADLPDDMPDPGTSGDLGTSPHLRGQNWDISYDDTEFLEQAQQSLGGELTIRRLVGIDG